MSPFFSPSSGLEGISSFLRAITVSFASSQSNFRSQDRFHGLFVIKMQSSTIRLIQTITISLIAALSIAIVGCAAHALHFYNNQRESNPWWLPLWPDHFNVRGTSTQIGASVTVLALSTFYLGLVSSRLVSGHQTRRSQSFSPQLHHN